MKSTQLIAITIALATITSVYISNSREISSIPVQIQSQFVNFIIKYKKTYSTPKEYIHRLKIFHKNVEEVKILAARNDITHQVGITKFFDLTKEEFRAKYTGLIFTNTPRNERWKKSNGNPDIVNWYNKGIVTPVKNQGNCGSCWAFSAIASTESAYAQAGNTLTQFSEQQLVDCSRAYGNRGCGGGWMDWAFHYIQDKGIMREFDYPYHARVGTCKAESSKSITKVSGWVDVPADNGQALEDASAQRVVSVAIDAASLFSYTGGVIAMGTCGTGLDHGVTVTGYNDQVETSYWLVKNSWGASWGYGGYLHLEKNVKASGHGTCGIRMKASYPTL